MKKTKQPSQAFDLADGETCCDSCESQFPIKRVWEDWSLTSQQQRIGRLSRNVEWPAPGSNTSLPLSLTFVPLHR